MNPDDKKFRELVLHVAMSCAEDPTFGATKLQKILFFSEFLAFGQLGQPITGMEFQKLENGPAVRRMLPIQEQMMEAGECAIQEREHFGWTQHRLIALREANLNNFSGREIAIVDSVIRQLWGMSAVEVSRKSHDFIGWQIARLGEAIPYETVLLDRQPLTEREELHAKELSIHVNA